VRLDDAKVLASEAKGRVVRVEQSVASLATQARRLEGRLWAHSPTRSSGFRVLGPELGSRANRLYYDAGYGLSCWRRLQGL